MLPIKKEATREALSWQEIPESLAGTQRDPLQTLCKTRLYNHEKLEQNDLTTQEYYKKTRNFTRNRELPRNLYSLNPASFLAIESVFNSLITEVMFFTTTDSSLLRWLYFIIGLCVIPASSSTCTVVSSVVLHMRQGLVVLFLAACFYKILYI